MSNWHIVIDRAGMRPQYAPIAITEDMTAIEIVQVATQQFNTPGAFGGTASFDVRHATAVFIKDANERICLMLINLEKPEFAQGVSPHSLGAAINAYLLGSVARQETKAPTPACPTCHSTRLTKLTAGSRFIDRIFFGAFSPEGKAQFRCEDCGYLF